MPYKNKEDIKKYNSKRKHIVKDQQLMKAYGITLENYNQMFADQAGCCYICNIHQSEFKRALAVDHCHTTGQVRGLLCLNCNTGLGSFFDDEKLLIKAIDYLREKNNAR